VGHRVESRWVCSVENLLRGVSGWLGSRLRDPGAPAAVGFVFPGATRGPARESPDHLCPAVPSRLGFVFPRWHTHTIPYGSERWVRFSRRVAGAEPATTRAGAGCAGASQTPPQPPRPEIGQQQRARGLRAQSYRSVRIGTLGSFFPEGPRDRRRSCPGTAPELRYETKPKLRGMGELAGHWVPLTRSRAPRGNTVLAALRPLRAGRRGASRTASPRRARERAKSVIIPIRANRNVGFVFPGTHYRPPAIGLGSLFRRSDRPRAVAPRPARRRGPAGRNLPDRQIVRCC
jgi:hypothetical protein